MGLSSHCSDYSLIGITSRLAGMTTKQPFAMAGVHFHLRAGPLGSDGYQ
jgi:hypothetical protein